MIEIISIRRACGLALFLSITASSVLHSLPLQARETEERPAPAAQCGATCVETRIVFAGGVAYAYRSLGEPSGVPLILLNRFRGTMDEWDPQFLDHIARRRHLIIFDNVGVARTTGVAPQHLKGWADGASAFIRALGYQTVDILGFSFGGLVAQELTLQHPDIVRRLIIVGSGAGYVEGANVNPSSLAIATKPVNSDEDFLYLFFKDTPTSQAAGRSYLKRLRGRADAFARLVSVYAWKAMLAAASDVSTAKTSLLNRSGAIQQPVLIANGNEDVLVPTFQSYALAQVIPNARLLIYPDSGHAFMFQYPQSFGDEVLRFLAASEERN